jgi:hypothetical protein
MRILLLFFVLLFTGCGAIDPVTITDSMVSETGDVITTGIVKTSDVDVVRSTNFAKMRMNRDNKQTSAHKTEGFKMEFVLVDLGNGIKAYMPKEITYKPELRFQDPMPKQEMVNPIYQQTKEIVLGVFDVFLNGFGFYVLGDAHKNSVEAAQPRYGGDYNYDSFNQTAKPYTLNPLTGGIE